MISVLYSATVWLEWQYNYSATVPSQFYGAKVLRLQFYWPNVRVPDTTEPRTWLIRQSASLLPPFAAVMSSSPPPPFVKWTHSSPPSVPVPVPPHSDHPLWPTPPLRLLSSSVSPSIPNLPLTYFSVVASTPTTTTTSSREEKTQWSVLLPLLQRKV